MGMKQDYEQKLQAKIEECQVKIEELKQKADKAESELRSECYKIIEDLRMKQEAVKGKLEEMRQVAEEAREDFEPGVVSLYDALTDAVGKAVEWAASRFK